MAATLGQVWLARSAESPVADASLGMREILRRGDETALRRTLSVPGWAESRDREGNTPLILAAQLGSAEMVRQLLEAGADPTATNRAGATALVRAATDPAKVRLLLEQGAKAEVATALGHTPLMLAARSPEALESVRLLLQHGANPKSRSVYGATPLMAAVASGRIETVRLLVERGADVNAVPLPEDPGKDPIWGGLRSPLMWAAYRGDTNLLAYLLDQGADANGATPFGTPLSHAGWGNRTEAARLLVARGADVRRAEPFSGFTPLHWAASAEDGDAALTQFLLAHGANPNAGGGETVDAYLGVPQTPLRLALKRGESAVTESLRKAGAKDVLASVPAAGDRRSAPSAGAAANHRIAEAVRAAIAPLQRTAAVSHESFVRHASRQNCASCHQQYFPMAAVGVAREHGVPSDASARRDLVDLVLNVHRGSELDAQPLFHPEPTHTFGYALLGLKLEGIAAPEVTDPLVHHLAAIQGLDGHWDLNLVRPPMQSSPITSTALGVFVLRHFGWPARQDEFGERIRRARDWLARAAPKTQEERSMHLLGLKWAGAETDSLREPAEALAAQQRPDGGWGQLAGLPSDAYATGQALFALLDTRTLDSRHPTIRRGVEYLVSTQLENGTWHVRRRAFPFQPTMESGFPHGRDSWISAAGTSWAVMALSLRLETSPVETHGTVALESARRIADLAAATRPAPTVVNGRSPGEPIDFVREIQPVLERSCVPCHRGERPRGGYRMTTRDGLISAGSQGIPSVVPDHSASSVLLKIVADEVPDLEMPPAGQREKYPALARDEIRRLRAWIDQGAPWPEGLTLGP